MYCIVNKILIAVSTITLRSTKITLKSRIRYKIINSGIIKSITME